MPLKVPFLRFVGSENVFPTYTILYPWFLPGCRVFFSRFWLCQVMYLSAQLPVRVGQLIKFILLARGASNPGTPFFQQLSAVFGKGFNLDVFFLQKTFAKTVMFQLLEGLSQQKQLDVFFLFPQIFGWDFFTPWSNNLIRQWPRLLHLQPGRILHRFQLTGIRS